MKSAALSVYILLLLLHGPGFSAEPDSIPDPDTALKPFYYTQYDKQLVTHLFTNKLLYKGNYSGAEFFAKNIFTSTITEVSSKFIKDEEETEITGEYFLNRSVSTGISASRIAQNDNRSVELNSSALNRYTLHLGIKPAGELYIRSFAGYSGHKQLNENNSGVYYGASAILPETFFENTRTEGSVLLSNEDIMPRRNLNRTVRLSVVNLFPEAILMGISADYTNQRRDFYLNADPALQSLHSITRNIQTRSEIKSELSGFVQSGNLFPLIRAEGEFRLQYRTVDRDYRYKPITYTNATGLGSELSAFRFEGSGSAAINFYPVLIRLRGTIIQQEEKNSLRSEPSVDAFLLQQFNQKEQEKNFLTTRISLGTSISWYLSEDEVFALDATQQKLTYDTPALLNYDDRDELISVLRISYENRTKREFQWSAGLEGYISRNAYLFAQRSANNSHNRFLKYFASSLLRFPGFTSRNYAEVSALYTVYDFEDLLPNYRSLSFRQFLLSDSTSVPLGGGLSFQADISLKLAEQGFLYWEEFSTLPERYVKEFLISPKLEYRFFNLIIFAGYRFLNISLFRYEKTVKSLSENYSSSGPVFSLYYSRGEKYSASLSIYQEYQKSNTTSGRQNSNINTSVQWFF
ncbi:MAG: hypothetical protein L6Q47_00430 [Ignavibacteriaceae bacterium]|nr:hypothetical protein [Ignavibacteriaceae bacterium]